MVSEMSKRILVVEDNPDNMYVMDRILTHNGYKVHQATSGQDALNLLATMPFDLILMTCRCQALMGTPRYKRSESRLHWRTCRSLR